MLSFNQCAVFQGAYAKHKLKFLHNNKKLQDTKIDLRSLPVPHEFFKQLSQVFTNRKIYKNKKLTSLSHHGVGEASTTSSNYGEFL